MDYKNNLCPLPWIELSANADTSLRVCCNTYHGGRIQDDAGKTTSIMSDEPLSKLYNKKTHREIREAMLKGEKPDFCKSCYDIESFGGKSTRHYSYNNFEHLIEGFVSTTLSDGTIPAEALKIRRIDLALSNICSLKCRMCTPSCSTSLKNEFDEVGLPYSTQEYEDASTLWRLDPSFKMIFDKHSDYLESVFTTGGEPFINKDHRDVLRIIKEKNIHTGVALTYHSSLHELPEELIDLWRGFKEVVIHLSLEGIKETNEYARFPSKWEKILGNLEKLKSVSDTIPIKLAVHSCVQAITWPHYYQLLFFTKNLNLIDPSVPCIPSPIWLETPTEMTATCLPVELRELGIRRLERALKHVIHTIGRPLTEYEIKFYDCHIAYINRLREAPFSEEDFKKFQHRVIAVDRFRQQNISDVIPDFREFFVKEIENEEKERKHTQIQILKNKGYKAHEKNDFNLGYNEFRKAWDLNKNDPESCYNVGLSLKMLNRKDEAINFFRETLVLDPNHYFSLIEVAWDELSNNNYKSALTLLEKALTHEPSTRAGEAAMFIQKCKKSRYSIRHWFSLIRKSLS